MKSYNKSEKSEELKDKIKQKFQLLKFLDKLHNIIMHICSSASHTAELEKLIKKMISLDNYIRWNSWYLSLIITDKYKSLINIYIKNYLDNLVKDYLTLQD